MDSARPVVALIPAAGSGARLGSVLPKALVPVGGVPIVRRTVETFLRTDRFVQIVVLAPADHLGAFIELFAPHCTVRVVAGGAERQASVARGLAHVERELPDVIAGGSILVHDAARCLVSAELIERCLAEHAVYRAVTAAIENVDTLVRGDAHGTVTESVDRRGIFAVQTPQVFTARLLCNAHARAEGGATDDASLVAACEPIHLVRGDRFNMKITTPEDLELAESILRGR